MSRKDRIDWAAIDRMLAHPNENFVELARAADLDPATDFVRTDLRNVDFGLCDLAGFNFEGANLDGANLSMATVDKANWEGIKGKPKWPFGFEPHQDVGAEEGEQIAYAAEPGPTFGQLQVAEDQAPFRHQSSSIGNFPSPPAGWTWIDKDWLDEKRQPLDDAELEQFFNGVLPQWRHALSDKIPRRDVVLDAAALLQGAASEPGRPRVVFLEGAGGEGKSTAFRQTVAQLLDDDPRWLVLWRENDFERIVLPKDFVQKLPHDDRPILIATDEAQDIARNLLAFIEEARKKNVSGLHVLIAARDTDWRAADPQQPRWEDVTDFHEKRLRGVSEADAGKIIDAWAATGGLGDLAGMPRQEAIRRFIQVARDEERKFGESALLGAMIELRMAEGFRPYVKKLLRNLDKIHATGGSLGHAYTYIAAMHAENLRFLSSPVLAHLLGCDETTLNMKVISPLADEAAGQQQGQFILTRHRRIAEMAMELLEEQGADRFELMAKLAVSAIHLRENVGPVVELAGWRYELSKHLIKRGRAPQALALARSFCELSPGNDRLLVNLARTLREIGEAKAAVDVFRHAPEAIARDRVFYYEWGTAAGNAGDHVLNVWLAGVSLSDADGLPRLDAKQVKLSLAGLGVACRELYGTSREKTFLRARGAAGQLGLRIPGRDEKRGFFRRYRDEAEAGGIEVMSVDAAVQAIEEVVLRAFDLSEVAEELADEGVPYRDEIYFKSLRDFPWRRD